MEKRGPVLHARHHPDDTGLGLAGVANPVGFLPGQREAVARVEQEYLLADGQLQLATFHIARFLTAPLTRRLTTAAAGLQAGHDQDELTAQAGGEQFFPCTDGAEVHGTALIRAHDSFLLGRRVTPARLEEPADAHTEGITQGL